MEHEYSKEDKEKLERFNRRFLLALDCFMPVVGRRLLVDCRDDIELAGVDYAIEKWEPFVVNSLTGGKA